MLQKQQKPNWRLREPVHSEYRLPELDNLDSCLSPSRFRLLHWLNNLEGCQGGRGMSYRKALCCWGKKESRSKAPTCPPSL